MPIQVTELTRALKHTSRNRLLRSFFFLVSALVSLLFPNLPEGAYALVAMVGVLCLWRMGAAWKNYRHPEKHRLIEKLSGLSEKQIPTVKIGALQVSEQFVLHEALFEVEFVFLADIMWVYKKGAKSVIHERNGYALEVHLTEPDMVRFCHLLAQHQPKIVFGYTPALWVAWKTQRETFIKNVDNARK